MGDFLNSLISLISNRDVKNSRKAIGFIVAIIILIFINDTFGFSRFYYESNRVKILSDISVLLKNDSLNPIVKKQLQAEQLEIVQMQPIYVSISHNLFFTHTQKTGGGVFALIKNHGIIYYIVSRTNIVIFFSICLCLSVINDLKLFSKMLQFTFVFILAIVFIVFIFNLAFPITISSPIVSQVILLSIAYIIVEYYKSKHSDSAPHNEEE